MTDDTHKPPRTHGPSLGDPGTVGSGGFRNRSPHVSHVAAVVGASAGAPSAARISNNNLMAVTNKLSKLINDDHCNRNMIGFDPMPTRHSEKVEGHGFGGRTAVIGHAPRIKSVTLQCALISGFEKLGIPKPNVLLTDEKGGIWIHSDTLAKAFEKIGNPKLQQAFTRAYFSALAEASKKGGLIR